MNAAREDGPFWRRRAEEGLYEIRKLLSRVAELEAERDAARAVLRDVRGQFFDDGPAVGWVKRLRDEIDAALDAEPVP